jgi:hypothetical protein
MTTKGLVNQGLIAIIMAAKTARSQSNRP